MFVWSKMKLAGDKMYVNCNDYTVNLSLCQGSLEEVDEYLSPKACKKIRNLQLKHLFLQSLQKHFLRA